MSSLKIQVGAQAAALRINVFMPLGFLWFFFNEKFSIKSE